MESRRPASLIAACLIALFVVTHSIAALRQIDAGWDPESASQIALEARSIPVPAERTPIDLTGLRGIRIEVGAFVDHRADTSLLGEQRTFDREGVVQPITTGDDVAEWTSAQVRGLLDAFGFETVDQAGDLVLTGEIERLSVVERQGYTSDVGLVLTVRDSSGTKTYEGLTAGSSRRFGKAFDPDHYLGALGESLLEAVDRLVRDDRFRAGLLRADLSGVTLAGGR